MSYETIYEVEIGNDVFRIKADYEIPSFIVEYCDKELDRGSQWYRVTHHRFINLLLSLFYLNYPQFKEMFKMFSCKEAWYDDWM